MTHPNTAFKLLSTTEIKSLNIEIQKYQHTQTGAVHLHLACEHKEKAFLVAFRTMPKDDTGIAHILEHTVLCGSEKYPVRDPFFMMTRRSLNTFMNAMTSSDWTAYPFASENSKDFYNLLDVYLDATFFSRLDPLDFAQEGHRLEFNEDTQKLEFKGVVFNEMKGAMSSISSKLWQGISRYLFPTNTYHYNSGGEPASITDLTYEQLLDFYKSHYHPSNAIFMSFGDLDINEFQNTLENNALSKFEKQHSLWQVEPERRMDSPMSVVQHYGLEDKDQSKKTHHVLGWLLGESTNLDEQLEILLLSDLLLENSASPLRKFLETTELGSAPSPMCGLEDSNREMSFLCGLEGSEPEQAQAFEAGVLACLKDVAEQGISTDVIKASLHQLELHQREIGGDHMPYGLQLMFDALPAAIHRGDAAGMLNLEPALESLKEKALASNFVKQTINRWLLDNPHRVRYTLAPSTTANAESEKNEQNKLARIQASLSQKELDTIKEQAQALKARQETADDGAALPKVTAQDIQVDIKPMNASSETEVNGLSQTQYLAGTNGIIYQQLIADIPELDAEQWQDLPLLSRIFSKVGVADKDYLQQQQLQTATVGSIGMNAIIKTDQDDANQINRYWCLSGKALASNAEPFSQLMQQTWSQLRLDEEERLKDLVKQQYAGKERGITGSGHAYAMNLAAASLNVSANVHEQLAGIHGISALKQQVKNIETNNIGARLQSLYKKIGTPKSALLVHDEPSAQAHQNALIESWKNQTQALAGRVESSWQIQQQVNYWMVDSQVNFCALAIPTVGINHADAPALTLLAAILRNGFLHTAIREKGGAYGGGATHDSSHECFKFYSYRDPRLEETFDDFYASINWFLAQPQDNELIEQALLGTFSSMDKPSSPAGEAKEAFHRRLNGRTDEQRMRFRQGLLATRWDDLQRVANDYLLNQEGYKGVIGKRDSHKLGENLGMNVFDY